jgi:CheY-like chemotaxis protein
MNLVSNGAEAMPEGGKMIISTENRHLDILFKGYETVEAGDYVIMRVSDSGIGISKEDLHRIFEPFYTKKIMGRNGTGLGMAVVWGTVKDHGGFVDVKSTRQEGTEITLYFPVTGKAVKEAVEAFSIETYMGKGKTVLVVDDVKEQREIAAMILTKLGYRVEVASSGEEAVEYARSHSVDLIVLDMIMEPGMDGLETFRRILEIHPGQKAIIASGYSETESVREAQRLGAGTYIKKPYHIEQIGIAAKKELEEA